MKSEVTIRRAFPEDYDRIAAFSEIESIVENTSRVPFLNAKQWRDILDTEGENIQLVADIEGKLVGHLGIYPYVKQREKHVATFGIVVHPDFHGKGIGSQLLEKAIHLADNWLQIIRFELTVLSDNPGAIHLYKKFGFEVEGEMKMNTFKQGEHTDHGTYSPQICL
ncbi:GNAT family N-acetyltransferase [Algicola sagamiensis]|uniref:GNAT family N-acetyltransferase n=1 Tax=Algicola sagamiensis TaxID=163869 RepID=UPI0003999D77|nr:GNAT family N-acetyltransferase [Algicola sagamiensis]